MLITQTFARSSKTYFKPQQKGVRETPYKRAQKLNEINFSKT